MVERIVKTSVKSLIGFALRSGSISAGYIFSNRAVEGIKAHQSHQAKMKSLAYLEGNEYIAELPLKLWFNYKDIKFFVEGRADGTLIKKEIVAIEEIKSVTAPSSQIKKDITGAHMAQLKCYGYMHCVLFEQEKIELILTYASLLDLGSQSFSQVFNFEELKAFFFELIEAYYVFAELEESLLQKAVASIKALDFPYESYRQGQRQLLISVYTTIKKGKKLFAEAPTGTGKTISTLFPSIKALGEGHIAKIFYLTGKTITRKTAEDTLKLMIKKGLSLTSIAIYAKEKACLNDSFSCNEVDCPYANGHFDRINKALLDILSNEIHVSREALRDYSQKHMVCPYEFSLDIALFSHLIVCDYNYVYDPTVHLKRFFGENSKQSFVLLHDEAHNLVDRGREMFSAQLLKSSFQAAKKVTPNKKSEIYKSLSSIVKFINGTREEILGEKKEPTELYALLGQLNNELEDYFIDSPKNEQFTVYLDLYFNSLDFIRISQFFDERYTTIIERTSRDNSIKLLCLDPSKLLAKTQKKVRASVFFSATLSPIPYFMDLFGGVETDFTFSAPSPFSPDNLKVVIDGTISTKYLDREGSYEAIAHRLFLMASARTGNYFAFFPSYEYLTNVLLIFNQMYSHGIDLLVQEQAMTEEDREEFLKAIVPGKSRSMIIFAVLGGVFSESIDLQGDKLIGAAIIGVGLPLLSNERNCLVEYYESKRGNGFLYGYVYPGMIKVLQAAGRVIRSETDKGVVLLIDNRYLTYQYKSLFPKSLSWQGHRVIRKAEGLSQELDKFWE